MSARSIAVLCDVHGNVDALEAVLAEPDVVAADLVVIGGDALGGPCPAQTMARIDALGPRALLVRGNGERELADPPAGDDTWSRGTRWAAAQLPPAVIRRMAARPDQCVVEIAGLGPVRLCHGSPRADDDVVTAVTPPARLRRILHGVTEPVVVVGHTHTQFDRTLETTRVVNAGSVGMPYEDRPGAYWSLLGPDVALRRTGYDLAAAAARIHASGWPDPEGFVDAMRTPPDPRATSARFEASGTG